jgi:hypothetical protein
VLVSTPRRAEFSAELFRGLNQEARKAGEDQEFLEVHGFMASKFESHASFLLSRIS